MIQYFVRVCECVFFYRISNVEFRPGDSLKTTCVYKTTSRTQTVFYGDDTSAEMCYGFIKFYPAEKMPIPIGVTWKSLDLGMVIMYNVNI